MAKSANLAYTVLNSSPHHLASSSTKPKTRTLSIIQTCNGTATAISATSSSNKSKHLHSPLIGKSSRASRRLITISTGDGKWHDEWTSDYKLSLKDLQLQDLVEVEEGKKKNAQVLVSLTIQKHASFGLTVDGNIVTSFTRKCSNCSSPYCREIDAKFKVWVLLASRDNHNIQIPDIGGDPSVIYVRPGYEADLDSLVQETIRLNTPGKDTCSELCEKSEATLQYINKVTTLEEYSKPLADYLENLPEDEKVILVGHSIGGACISYAMEHYSQKISKAIFLCATMVTDGQKPFDVFADQDVALAMASMRPSPLVPIMKKLSLSPEKYGSGRGFIFKHWMIRFRRMFKRSL